MEDFKVKARKLIIAQGVSNIKEFGYESVSEDNILTDAIYSLMFKKMLINNKGEDLRIDEVLDSIIAEIK